MEVTLVVVLRPFEHQVLEQMREACPARMLVLGSHVIPDIDGNHRQPTIFVNDHAKAVRERVLGEGDIHCWCITNN